MCIVGGHAEGIKCGFEKAQHDSNLEYENISPLVPVLIQHKYDLHQQGQRDHPDRAVRSCGIAIPEKKDRHI